MAEYGKYLASREWAVLKTKVRQRSGGICERCRINPHQETHHVTYERFGRERLEDLQGVCRDCHKFVSNKSDFDPLNPPLTTDAFLQEQALQHDLQPDFLGPILAKGLEVTTAAELVAWNTEVAQMIGRFADNPMLASRLAQIKLRINQQFYNRQRAS